MEPDREGDIGRGEAVEQVGAGARIISPIRQHVIERTTRLGGSPPSPRFRQDIRSFRQRDRAVACRRRDDAERVTQGHFRRPAQYGKEPANCRGGAQMMYAIASEVLGRQQSERQAPGGFVGRVNRKHFDLETRLDQRPHVAFEERAGPRRIHAREDRDSHRDSGMAAGSRQRPRRPNSPSRRPRRNPKP